MKMLSIILPIYNVEQYLAKCLNSIYTQNVDEELFEVIAVIDGSPDESLKIAENYAQLHKNIIVINKDNGGVSSARNKGVAVAQGEYLMFVDPDDYLLPDSLFKVIESINRGNADMYIYRCYDDAGKGEISPWKGSVNEKEIYTGIQVYEKWGARGCVWGVTYNRDFWRKNGFSFPTGIANSEDSILFLQCQMKAGRMQFSDIDLYAVYTRPDSASHDITIDRLEKWFDALEYVQDTIKKTDNCVEIAMLDGLKYSIISSITNNSILISGWNSIVFLREHHVTDYLPISSENIRRSSVINRIMKMVINTSFNMFFFVSYLRNKLF